jgi:hypothetical protein
LDWHRGIEKVVMDADEEMGMNSNGTLLAYIKVPVAAQFTCEVENESAVVLAEFVVPFVCATTTNS